MFACLRISFKWDMKREKERKKNEAKKSGETIVFCSHKKRQRWCLIQILFLASLICFALSGIFKTTSNAALWSPLSKIFVAFFFETTNEGPLQCHWANVLSSSKIDADILLIFQIGVYMKIVQGRGGTNRRKILNQNLNQLLIIL